MTCGEGARPLQAVVPSTEGAQVSCKGWVDVVPRESRLPVLPSSQSVAILHVLPQVPLLLVCTF
eukprot:jgi/Botrbrau1/2902/Bobra.0036s0043.1